jgi:UDP-N-acetyl-2-amino-2-deoxyglucuronate dehydrogenase
VKKIKTAVIGLGKVTPIHAKAFQNLSNSEFSACVSRDIKKAEMFAKEYKIKPYDNIEKMINETGVEAVSICTPHPVHKESALAALNAGAHVLMEKPLAVTVADCDEIINTAKSNNLTLAMISQRRFYPSVMRLKKAIDDGKIGKPIIGTVVMLGWRDEIYYKSDPWRGSWRGEGGGVLVNQSPHQIDIMQWLMNDKIDEVYGVWANLNHPYIEVEDSAAAIIKFKNGGIGNIVVSNSCNPALYGKVHIHGDNGASLGVQTDGGMMFIAGMSGIAEPPFNDIWTVKGEEEYLEKWKKEDADFFSKIDPTEYFHEKQFEDFLNSIIEKKKPLISGEEGRITVEIFTAIYRSQRDGKPVKFPVADEGSEDFDGRLR